MIFRLNVPPFRNPFGNSTRYRVANAYIKLWPIVSDRPEIFVNPRCRVSVVVLPLICHLIHVILVFHSTGRLSSSEMQETSWYLNSRCALRATAWINTRKCHWTTSCFNVLRSVGKGSRWRDWKRSRAAYSWMAASRKCLLPTLTRRETSCAAAPPAICFLDS